MSASQTKAALDLVDRLFNDTFDTPREPRSPEYKAGVRAVLTFRVHGTRIPCPFPRGTAQADAYFAGIYEGHHVWGAHVSAIGPAPSGGRHAPR